MNSYRKYKIAIIGNGKTGSAFALELFNAGYSICTLIDRNIKNVRRLGAVVKAKHTNNRIQNKILSECNVILIAVQDRYITEVLTAIKKENPDIRNKLIINTSGSAGLEIYKPFGILKPKSGSVHPLQTFNKISLSDNGLLRNIYFGVTGGAEVAEFAKNISKRLKSKVLIIPDDKKVFYHIACVIASNYLVASFGIIDDIFKRMNIKKSDVRSIFFPIINNTLSNIMKEGISESLTGPIKRKDSKVIESHLELLKKSYPELLPFYISLGKEAVKLSSLEKGH